MNCEEFSLESCEFALPVVKESLRCIVSTILFARSIGGNVPLIPRVCSCDILRGIDYVDYSDELTLKLNSKINEFTRKLEGSNACEFVLSFYVPRQSHAKSLWDILSQPFDDKPVFERWRIPVILASSFAGVVSLGEEEERLIESAKTQVRDRMFFVLKKINERMDHLPPPPADQPVYHFEIIDTSQGAWSPKNIAQSIRGIPFIT